MTRMTGPDCVVMCNLINTYIHITLYSLFSVIIVVRCFRNAGQYVPHFFSCLADPVPGWQPRIILDMVETQSVNNIKNTNNTHIIPK